MESSDINIRFQQFIRVVCSNREEAERIVGVDPEIIHIRNGLGETPFHYLAIENYRDAVDWLRRKGASVDNVNDFGQTPLVEVAGLGNLEMCKCLINNGANLRHISKHNEDSCFSLAATREKEEILSFLLSLLDSNEDINPFFGDMDAEMIISENSHITEILVQRGLKKRFP